MGSRVQVPATLGESVVDSNQKIKDPTDSPGDLPWYVLVSFLPPEPPVIYSKTGDNVKVLVNKKL